jgi:hypothetical protein
MATNRDPLYAPPRLLSLSKATLVDLVWELAGTSPGVDCDSFVQKTRYLCEAAKGPGVQAPNADRRLLEKMVAAQTGEPK